ncbi:uncharacterized protein TNCV_3562981 [Trichonephila clavipes]|nr:uncharacterized protein TNCV_3562981 [Trichonephila clavipes]
MSRGLQRQFFFDKEENASQVAEIANGVYGANTVTANYRQFWFRRFRSGIFDVKDVPRTGSPVVENFDKITEIIEADRLKEARCLGATPMKTKKMMDRISICETLAKRTATAGSDVVQSGRPIFDDFFQHLWPYIGNNTANVVFQRVKRLGLIRIPMTLHSPTENSLAVFNHKILEANSQVQNVKLNGQQTCLSINRLWHELCDMLRRLVGTTVPGHHDCSIHV